MRIRPRRFFRSVLALACLSAVELVLPRVAAAEEFFDDHGHAHDHSTEGGAHSCPHDCYPEDQFDFFRPFESHGGGEHEHGQGHSLGHDRHESVDGYPFMHALRTEHAFIERKVELQFADSWGADGGEVDETELEMELFWAINNRMAVVVEAPIIFLDPETGPKESGVGDLEVGFRFVAFNAEYTLLTFGLNVVAPTGDDERDLGAGHAALEPVALGLFDLGCGTTLQTEVGFELPVDVDEPENEFIYNVALGHTFLGTECNSFFRWVTPFIEFNGTSALNGDDSGHTVIDVTPGVSWQFSRKSEVAVGYSRPITGDRNFDDQFRIAYYRHF